MDIFKHSIPVIAYHQVCENSKITPKIFLGQMNSLYNNGFKTVTLDQFYSHITKKSNPSGKKILITFDDGFADNYIHAYPILKQFSYTAALFPITSRITMSDDIRYTSDDLKNRTCDAGELFETNWSTKANANTVVHGATRDFLTSGEMKKMADDSVMEFGSHTHSHARYFSSGKIVDFFNPDSHWAVLCETAGKQVFGIPVYEMKPAVCGVRYLDDKKLRDFLHSYVAENGGRDFFVNRDYKEILYSKVEEFKEEYGLTDQYETVQKYEQRVTDDLMTSKEVIKKIIGNKIDFLCWPWGEYSDSAIKIAKKCGFKGIFSLDRGANIPGSDPFNIKRLEIKAKGMKWFNSRVNTYSSGIKAKIYGMVR